MTPSRILLVAAGLGVAAVAIFLVVRGLGGMSSAPRPSGPGSETAGTARGGSGRAGEEVLPLWRDFQRPGDPDAAPARPVETTEIAFVNPFDRAYALAELEKSALRLEGVAPGDSAVALISGRVVRVGTTIDAFRILAIDSSGVSMEGPAGVRIDLALGDSVLPESASEASPPPAASGGRARPEGKARPEGRARPRPRGPSGARPSG